MDWQKDDTALCIRDSATCPDCGNTPDYRSGQVFRVSDYRIETFDEEGDLPALFFYELPDELETGPCVHVGYDPGSFIKLNGPEADAFDREVIEALKSEPVHVPQHDALHNSCQCEVSGCLSLTQVRQ